MAVATATNVLIDRVKISLQSGLWALIWGDTTDAQTFNPQALPNQKVVVVVDTSGNNTSVDLPPTSQQPTNFVQLYINKTSGANQLFIYPANGDTINGLPDLTITGNFASVLLQNLAGNDWTVISNGKK